MRRDRIVVVAVMAARAVVRDGDDVVAAAAAAAAVFRARARIRMATQSNVPSSRVKGASVVVPKDDETVGAAVPITAADSVADTAVASIGAFVCTGDV